MMLSLRDRQNAPFGCSDLYIVVVLTAKSTVLLFFLFLFSLFSFSKIMGFHLLIIFPLPHLSLIQQKITPCEVEVALAEWRDVRQVAQDPDLYSYNRALFECAIKIAEERERRREGKEKEGGLGFEMAPFPGFGNSGIFLCKYFLSSFSNSSIGAVYNVWTGASLVEDIERNSK